MLLQGTKLIKGLKTKAIRNLGNILIMKFLALNKISVKFLKSLLYFFKYMTLFLFMLCVLQILFYSNKLRFDFCFKGVFT